MRVWLVLILATASASVRRKRDLGDLREMLECVKGKEESGWDYVGYGCWCGIGGSGTPVDGIDSCCKSHDDCWAASSCSFFSKHTNNYRWACRITSDSTPGKQPLCAVENSKCESELCACDARFTHCLAAFPHPKEKPKCTVSWFRRLFG